MTPIRRPGFSLIELLVVIAIIAILVGLLLPAVTGFKRHAEKVACSSNLKQIGQVIQLYADAYNGEYPIARYMPLPFVSSSTDPPLIDVLVEDLGASGPAGGPQAPVYHCPSDPMVFDLAGDSYEYNILLDGQKPEQTFPVQQGWITLSQLVVQRDFDGATFDTTDGPLDVPFFHKLRNLQFADGHVGNF